MIENGDLEERHVIPRWLPIGLAIESGMFARPGLTKISLIREKARGESEQALTEKFESILEDWRKSGEEADAEELLATSIVANKVDDAEVHRAASKISSSDTVASEVKQFALRILSGVGISPLMRAVELDADLHMEIRKRKILLDLNPRDALLLAETALCHANLGQVNKSEKLLRQAMALAPNSRYVLRSAARFFCHSDRPDEALWIIRRTPRHQTDPWLKAAELAVAGMIGEGVVDWRKSRALVENEALSLRDRSELASEIATLEFQAGARRAGIKKLQIAVKDPTENATAQVEFLGRKTGGFTREELLPDISKSMEAKAVSCYWTGNLVDAFDACEQWQKLEPFSIRPAIFGSFLSSSQSSSLDRGLNLALAGLRSNPHNATLLNNVAVLYAYKGNLDLARQFAAQARSGSDDKSLVANRATEGLILFREGNLDDAIQAYEQAIEMAVKEKRIDLLLRAYAFYAREMCRADPALSPGFQNEFEKLEAELKRRKISLPRDVSIIRNELKPSDAEAQVPQLRLPQFREELIDRVLES